MVHSPFGMQIENQSYANSGNVYRYGFNGIEVSSEYSTVRDLLLTSNRPYSPGIAKWLSVDPLAKKYPSLSPYHFANLNPLTYMDPSGLEGEDGIKGYKSRRKQRKFERKLYKLSRRNRLPALSVANFNAMESRYGKKKWFWAKHDINENKTSSTISGNNNGQHTAVKISDAYTFNNWSQIVRARRIPMVTTTTVVATYNWTWIPPAGAAPSRTFTVPRDGSNFMQASATSITSTPAVADNASITTGGVVYGPTTVRWVNDGPVTGMIMKQPSINLSYNVDPRNSSIGPSGATLWSAVAMSVQVQTFRRTSRMPTFFPKTYAYNGKFKDFVKLDDKHSRKK